MWFGSGLEVIQIMIGSSANKILNPTPERVAALRGYFYGGAG
ncbi:MAG: hypothetical protein ACI9XC_002685 [Gammaproteobacteria bacterium]|jgi:hypothetical protein